MQGMRASATARVFGPAIVVAAVLLVAAGAPAFAGQQDYQGWFVSLDAATTQPNGLDQQYMNLIDVTDHYTTRKVIDNDSDFTWKLKIGYSWGELGGLSVSYWSFDNEDRVSGTEQTQYVYPTVFGAYGWNNGGSYGLFNYPTDFKATSKTKASTLDLDFFRPTDIGEKTTIKWIAGLRSATFEEDRGFDGVDGAGYYYIQSHHVESDAFGVKVGATATFNFTEHFSLQGGMAFSFLQANNKGKATQNADGTPDQIKAKDDNVRGEIRDFDVRAVWSWERYDFHVGYGGQTWDGLVSDPIDGSCCGASGAGRSTRDSVSFNSVHAGVTFRFGGGG